MLLHLLEFILGLTLILLRESKWPGLVLPIISFLISFIYPLNMAIPSLEGFFAALISGWLIANIPTCVLLAIYFACRGKYRKRKQLDKMNIQDLG